MNLKQIIFYCLILCLPTLGFGQFYYSITTEPEGAEVFLNGKLNGTTPCKVSFFWKEVPDSGMVFSIRKAGFVSERFVVDKKPGSFRTKKKFTLHKFLPKYDLDSAMAMIEFDRFLAEFPSGKVVGKAEAYGKSTDLTWEGFTKVGTEPIAEKTYDLLGSTGFNTPVKASTRLFSDEKHAIRVPRFLLGAQVEDLWMDIKSDYREIDAQVKLKIVWQVFDRTSNKVVLTSETSTTTEKKYNTGNSNGSVLVDAYGDALIAFLTKRDLYELVKDAGVSGIIPEVAKSNSDEPKTPLSVIKKVTPPKFESNPEMIQYATAACVTIATDGGHGSGVFISNDGYVLTAAHVVEGVNRIRVVLPSGLELEPKVVLVDTEYDIALLDLEGSGFKTLAIGEGLKAGLGIEVITIGTPGDLDLGQSISKGIVSGKRKFENIIYIQTDVAVSPGNSGGPLIDNAGNIIGIIQRKLIGNGIEGIGFALPIETVLKRVNLSVEE